MELFPVLKFGWSLITGTLAARAVLQVSWWKAFLATLAGATVGLGIFFTFIR